MKSFWKRKPKKKPTKRNKSHYPNRAPKPKPEPWVPLPKEATRRTLSNVPLIANPENASKNEEKKSNRSVRTDFLKTFHKLSSCRRTYDVWSDFITMFACAISNSVDKQHFDERERRYLNIIQKYGKHEQSLFPELAALTVEALEECPEQDFLGSLYMELKLCDAKKQQFFTPYHVADLMARMAMTDVSGEVKEKGYLTINDSCCGGGVTLIAGINEARRQLEQVNLNFQNHIMVVGQDIDELVAMMCYIQVSLLGIAGYIKVGNSLLEPVADGDSTENYWFTPMYCCSSVWQYRRIFQKIEQLTKGVDENG